MIGFNIQCGDEETQKWVKIASVDLIPLADLYPEENLESDNFGINDFEFSIPNGEKFTLTATYTSSNTGVIVVICSNETVLLNVACWIADDCNILFSTPKGVNVNISFGKNS